MVAMIQTLLAEMTQQDKEAYTVLGVILGGIACFGFLLLVVLFAWVFIWHSYMKKKAIRLEEESWQRKADFDRRQREIDEQHNTD